MAAKRTREHQDRRLVAYALHALAEQVETGHIDGVLFDWTLGDDEVKTEVRRRDDGARPVGLALVPSPPGPVAKTAG